MSTTDLATQKGRVATTRGNQRAQAMRHSVGKSPQAVKWQPLLTLKGELPGADPVEVVQPASFWLDTTQLNNVVVRTDISRIDVNCHTGAFHHRSSPDGRFPAKRLA